MALFLFVDIFWSAYLAIDIQDVERFSRSNSNPNGCFRAQCRSATHGWLSPDLLESWDGENPNALRNICHGSPYRSQLMIGA